MRVDHGSPVPLHAQVESLLREMLKQPRYREGELLPPEARIAEQLEVSRNTVRAAISRLVQEGVLERKAGRGTRYVHEPLRTSLKNWPSFSREMKQEGIEVVVFSLQTGLLPPTDEVARALRLTAAETKGRVLKMERIRGYQDVPAVYSISWFHPRTGLQAADDFSRPLYQLVHAKSGLEADSSEEEISASLADRTLAGNLACKPGDAILVRRRIVRDPARKEIEYNLNYYRADRFTYGLTLQK
ncbi:GntR family transcriptional regulator [Luteolibacter marinus]|uniref:GntR family transcriptional regulator n=1 Tax=Luteolibacter marinus TaxID=2776705 RepID=UPI001868D07D|nr:GntR family transcriptional regulator [Luteolibacter marinus]